MMQQDTARYYLWGMGMKEKWYKWFFLYIGLISLYSFNAFSESMPAGWARVSLVYYKDFPAPAINNSTPVSGCILKAGVDGTGSMRWHCQEKVYLLRPLSPSQVASLQQKPHRFSDAVASDFNHANARVTSVHLLKKAPVLSDRGHMSVTGIFITHSLKVKQYRFKNVKTGDISSIRATDNHPFYSKDSGSFVPVSSLSSNDHLINNKQETVQLLCTGGGTTDCGISASGLSPALVYNLETYKKHTFYAGHAQILVHNCTTRPLYDHSRPRVIKQRELSTDDATGLIRKVKGKQAKSISAEKTVYYFFNGTESDDSYTGVLFDGVDAGPKPALSAEEVVGRMQRAPEFNDAEAVYILHSIDGDQSIFARSFRAYFQKVAWLSGKKVLYNAKGPMVLESYTASGGKELAHVQGLNISALFAADIPGCFGSLMRRLFGAEAFQTNYFKWNRFEIASPPNSRS